MVQDTPSRKLDQYIVRFPDGMRDRLKEEAAQNNRSLNAEIIARLSESFDPVIARTRKGADPYEVMEEIIERVIRKVRSEESQGGAADLLD